ncbi:hypothetical protein D3C75_1218760 [compost metagenome]
MIAELRLFLGSDELQQERNRFKTAHQAQCNSGHHLLFNRTVLLQLPGQLPDHGRTGTGFMGKQPNRLPALSCSQCLDQIAQ